MTSFPPAKETIYYEPKEGVDWKLIVKVSGFETEKPLYYLCAKTLKVPAGR